MEIINQLIEPLKYAFIQRALIAGCCMAVGCAFLGVFLVLRRFSLIGDGLAHASFATVSLGLLLGAEPMIISIPLVAAASLLILNLNEKVKINGDAAIGLVSAFSIAFGVTVASIAGGFNVDLFSYLFGNILSISKSEVLVALAVSVIVVIIVKLFYHDFFAITFDEDHARISGINVSRINKVLILLTSLIIVIGIKIVGTMLVSSLIILPAVSALQLVKSFKSAILLASLFALLSIIVGIFLSYVFNLPSGASIVIVNFIFFIGALVKRKTSK